MVELSNSPYTTNRILEIPQDIKLELNNGTLTIKEGTKGYNGNGLFYTVTSDITYTTSINDTYFLYLRDSSPYFRISNKNESGTSVPSGYTGAFFHTDTGICNFYSSGTLIENLSLPIAIITVSNGAISSIDQVFNGFGYIGSTAFILPGVKIQAPNGRNEDGSYKSNIITQTTVGLTTFTVDFVGTLIIRPNSAVPLFSTNWKFNEDNGYISTADGTPTNLGSCVACGYLRTESLKIVNFEVGNVDSVANSNMSNISEAGRSFIAGMGMPSSKYENWTLGASGSRYTAPANGYIYIDGYPNAAIVIIGGMTSVGNSSFGPVITFPVRKGKSVEIRYTGTMNLFGFYYAVGEN